MFSTWDIVRPRYWHPMASLEQSMMDMDHMADLMLQRPQQHARFPFRLGGDEMMLAAPDEDDDFFNDLPVRGRQDAAASQAALATDTSIKQQQPQQSTEQTPERQQGQQQEGGSTTTTTNNNNNNNGRTFSTYSFSNSSIVDDKGHRVVSTRRRYEDSTGRLKAVHERQIEDKKLRAVWNRMHKDDAGAHDQICENGTPEEFEAAWKQTPFGEAHEKEQTRKKSIEDKKDKATDKKKEKESAANAS